MLLTILQLSKAFGDNQILDDVALTMQRGDKWGLVGANGAGKSTLIKIIVGEIEPDAGTVEVSADADVGYLPQILGEDESLTIRGMLDQALDRVRTLEQQLRILEQAMSNAQKLEPVLQEYGALTEEFERLGGYGLAHHIDVVFAGLGLAAVDRDRTVASLSGGEKSRFGLAALLLRSPDLLLLDEPTNHLSFDVLEEFEAALLTFPGAIVAISHDRRFIERQGEQIWELRDGRLIRYLGGWDEYRDQHLPGGSQLAS